MADNSEVIDARQVLKQEKLEIFHERAARLKKDRMSQAEEEELTEPPVGLALSGGGIRSATLGLGVLQWLSAKREKNSLRNSTETSDNCPKDLPLIEHIDYLSTVSGGGYIGSWFLANRLRDTLPTPPEAIPRVPNDFINRKNSALMGHLRRFSRYLAPESGLMSADTWTMAAVWCRNTFLIQAMVFCAVATVFLVARFWGMAVMMGAPAISSGQRGWGSCFMIPMVMLLAFAAWKAGQELDLYEKDDLKKNQPGEDKKRSDLIEPKNQQRIQRDIVLPTVLSGFILTLGMWWRHNRPENWIEGKSLYGCDWWAAWLDGKDPSSITLDPAIWLMCILIGSMAFWLVGKAQDRTGTHRARGLQLLVLAGVVLANMSMMYVMDELFRVFMTMQTFPAHVAGLDEAWIKLRDCILRCNPCEDIPKFHLMIPMGGALAAVLGPTVVLCCYSLVVILGLGLMGRRMPDKVREWWSRLGAWLMIYCFAILVVTALAILSPLLVEWFVHMVNGWISTGILASWGGLLASSIFFGKSSKTTGAKDSKKFGVPLGLVTFLAVTGLLVLGAWLVRFMLTPDLKPLTVVDPFLVGQAFSLIRHILVTVAVVGVGLILVWRIDLNEFSMNQFYRNRLVRCYLGGSKESTSRRFHPFTGFDFKDDLPLASFILQTEGSSRFKGPYPLIGAALNTSQGNDLEVQERKAESFLFSPLYCGFSRHRLNETPDGKCIQGFRETDQYMAEDTLVSDGGITLGTAMSISGAAASPNSGYHTSPLMAFLLTIFNARLGSWMPNPAKKEWRSKAPSGLGFLKYLIFELFGSATPSSSFVYVSDGGHFENLGVYELVRRRCRLIIVVDGEQDGLYTFHALGTAIRRCRVDFQTEIEINVSDIKPSPETGLSRNHGAVGKIHYPPAVPGGKAEEGVLVYLKSSLTGDEETDIRQFAALSPVFPHESTGDQFFSESQFESYRSLGHHMAEEIFGGAFQRRVNDPAEGDHNLITYLMDELTERWFRPAKVPSRSFVDHTRALDVLWQDLCRPGIPPCLGHLVLTKWSLFQQSMSGPVLDVPESTAVPPPTSVEELRIVYAYCERMIQLMENVYLDLQLEVDGDHVDNLGWMELFKYWVRQDIMKKAWEHSHETFGKRFGKFWQDLSKVKDSDCSKGNSGYKKWQIP